MPHCMTDRLLPTGNQLVEEQAQVCLTLLPTAEASLKVSLKPIMSVLVTG